MFRFEDIYAWQKAHAFVLLVYRVTGHFPEVERFGLISQFRRAAVSIEANIAEGYKSLAKLTNSASSTFRKEVLRNVEITSSYQEI